MSNTSGAAQRARAARQQAQRARRLAYGLPAGADRERLLQHAEELEQRAAALEAEASGAPPVRNSGRREQQQTQQQQQQGEEPAPPAPDPKPKS